MFLKRSFVLALWVVILGLSVVGCGETSTAPTLYSAKGERIDLKTLKNKWLILNYWAGWCKTCLKEIETLNAFYQKHQQKEAVLLSINYDHLPIADLNLLSNNLNIQYPILIQDPAEHFNLEPVTVVPTTIVIAPGGEIKKVIVGQKTQSDLDNLIQMASTDRWK